MRVSTLIHSSFLKVEREHSHFRATPEMTLKAAVSLTIFLYGNFIFIGFGGVLLFFFKPDLALYSYESGGGEPLGSSFDF